MTRSRAARKLLFLVLLSAMSVPGCSGCRDKAPLEFVPKDALAVAVFPSIAEAIAGMRELLDRFRGQAPVKMALSANKGALVKELGFDPEKPQTMKSKGIDADRGLVISLDRDGRSLTIVAGESDSAALEKYLREMATKLTSGKARFEKKMIDGVHVSLVLEKEMEGYPRMAWAHTGKQVIICPRSVDGKVGQRVARVAKLQSGIAENRVFARLREQIGEHQALLYVDGTSARKLVSARLSQRAETASEWMQKHIKEQQETLDGFFAYLEGAAAALHLSDKGVVARLHVAIPKKRARQIAKILQGRGDAPDFGEFIGPDALLIARLSIDVKGLLDRTLEAIPPRAKRELYRDMDSLEQQTKINLEKDVLRILAGRFAAVHYAPAGGAGLPQGFSLHRPESLMPAIPLVAMAQVTDAKKAAELLSTLERVMTRDGLDIRTRSDGERITYMLGPSKAPYLSWTVAEDLVLLATGDRLARTLELMNKGGENVLGHIDLPRARKLFKSEDGNVIYYRFSRTVDAIRGMNLPMELKLMLSPVTSALATFSDITLDLEAEDDGLRMTFNVRLR